MTDDTITPDLTLTGDERDVIAHATGWDARRPLYRNHYVAGPGHDRWIVLQLLCARGLVRVLRPAAPGQDVTFGVTVRGIVALKKSDRDRRAVREAWGQL